VIMITGDYALTAASIGQQIGLGRGSPLKAFTGAEISEMDDERLRGILEKGKSSLPVSLPNINCASFRCLRRSVRSWRLRVMASTMLQL